MKQHGMFYKRVCLGFPLTAPGVPHRLHIDARQHHIGTARCVLKIKFPSLFNIIKSVRSSTIRSGRADHQLLDSLTEVKLVRSDQCTDRAEVKGDKGFALIV